MWFRLALAWGCTVREAQDRCDSNEFTEWLAFWKLNPFGPDIDDQRAAWLPTMFFNANRRKDANAAKFSDFQFGDHKPMKPESSKEQWAQFKANIQATGKVING